MEHQREQAPVPPWQSEGDPTSPIPIFANDSLTLPAAPEPQLAAHINKTKSQLPQPLQQLVEKTRPRPLAAEQAMNLQGPPPQGESLDS